MGVLEKITGVEIARNVDEFRGEIEQVYGAVATRIVALEERMAELDRRLRRSERRSDDQRLKGWHLLAIASLGATSGALGAWFAVGIFR